MQQKLFFIMQLKKCEIPDYDGVSVSWEMSP